MWKKRKRSGAMKRKIEREYLNICNFQPSNSDSGESLLIDEGKDVFTSQDNLQSSVSSINVQRGFHNHESCVESVNSVQVSEISNDVSSCSISSTSNSNDEDDEFSKNLLFRQQIKEWAIEKNISQAALNELSKIVNNRFPGLLPNDARTILGTVRQINIKTVGTGEYWHNGLTVPLKNLLEHWTNFPTEVTLNFNFDGLPIFKSSNKEFWPILCSVFERPDVEPIVIGIYFGIGKPNPIEQYLEDFVNEMEYLIKNGLYIGQAKNKVSIRLRCFICDSPARAYIKELLHCVFVDHFKDFYGEDYMTSNVHNVVHITDEVQRFGPLPTFSAYPFENKLFSIKRMLRQGNNPLAQVAKRCSEVSKITKNRENQQLENREPFVTTNSRNLTVLHLKEYIISTKSKDKYFLCNSNDVLEVKKISVVSSEIKIYCYKIWDLVEVFEKPVKSSYLNIFKAKLPARRTDTIVGPQDIKMKLVCTEHNNHLYFVPLLHTV
ncbi:hypothetical protein SFRURICE_001245 [Spodoptera frugiperda]|nr:hypothetical protein SFRURICE_001245 [Spodoptera frugiperda]